MAEADDTGGDCDTVPPAGTDSLLCDEYECKICYNDFDLGRHIPKLLSCSHTFCQECLEALHSLEGRRWRIGCPLCRHRTPVPEYRVPALPDNTALIETLPPSKLKPDDGTDPVVSAATSRESRNSCQTCKQVAFTATCVCAMLSFLSMVVLLMVGLIFVHNFNKSTSPVGPLCLFVASVLALLSLIFTWLMCMLKYRPETDAGQFSSL